MENLKKFNGVQIWHLAHAIGNLRQELNFGEKSANIIAALEQAKYNLDLFVNNNTDKLPLCTNKANEIIKSIEALIAEGIRDTGLMSRLNISYLLLSASIDTFQTVLMEEIPQIDIFYIASHRCYNTKKLIKEGENLLSPFTVKLLGQSKKEVIQDVREAARCLAFGFSTAVGFHLYRAIEAIVVMDYFPVLGVVPADYEKNPNLGKYIRLLEDKDGDKKIIAMLTHLKDHYRNPIMHPDEFWDIDKANSAIGPAISLIDVMVQEIEVQRLVQDAQTSSPAPSISE